MLKLLSVISLLAVLIFTAQDGRAQVQFFPPQGPCSGDNPILAWNGNGNTYCTRFPTAAMEDCKDGEFLTKRNGQLVCTSFSGAVSSSTNAGYERPPLYNSNNTPTGVSPTAGATTAYTSSNIPTGIPPSVAATNGPSYGYDNNWDNNNGYDGNGYGNGYDRYGDNGNGYGHNRYGNHGSYAHANNYCPDITIPACSSEYILVDYGRDSNGCQKALSCVYAGSAANARSIYNTYNKHRDYYNRHRYN